MRGEGRRLTVRFSDAGGTSPARSLASTATNC